MKHDCSEELKEFFLQVTPARIAAMQLFESHDVPLDAKHVIRDMQKKVDIDRVTVFRILNAFVDKGLLTRFEFREGKTRYELTSRGDHHHFVCSSCGDILDLKEDEILQKYREKMEKKYGFKISEHTLEFFGVCKNCQ